MRFKPQFSLRKNVLRSDAVFLGIGGGVQLVQELLGHFAGKGLYHNFFYHSPYTIGFFEAHGLAVLIAILFVRIAAANPQPYWHQFGLGLHLMLGAAN